MLSCCENMTLNRGECRPLGYLLMYGQWIGGRKVNTDMDDLRVVTGTFNVMSVSIGRYAYFTLYNQYCIILQSCLFRSSWFKLNSP